jgi:hypothetical protein
VNRVAWRGDGKRVATAGMDHRALLWNPAVSSQNLSE